MSETTSPHTTQLRRQRTPRRWAFMPLIALLAVLLHWLLFQGQESVPGVITRPLGPCVVDWFENKGGVLVLGCPHMDMLKLWPLPMEQPWWEDLPVRPGEKVG
jgi:hypothetical protein